MPKPPIPIDETARIRSLQALRILDTRPEERFDRITRMAQRIFDVETCAICLVDADRQWFKSMQGLGVGATARARSFCGYAILDDAVLVVRDAATDERFADNPLVAGEPGVRFYAGCPVRSPEGYRIGTLCLIDSVPRGFSAEDDHALRDLVEMVEDELDVSAQVAVDELTQLANRRGFYLVAGHMLALCRRTRACAELLFFELDGVGRLDDERGHAARDRALRAFADALLGSFRDADVVARLDGDAFVVLMTASRNAGDIALNRLRLRLAGESDHVPARPAFSVGRVRFDPKRHACVDSLLEDGERRMCADKAERRSGRACRLIGMSDAS